MHVDGASDPLEVRLCKQLWAAVFQLAVEDAINNAHGARDWVDEPRHGPGSFTWLCELFGYDSIFIRRIVEGKYK